MRHRIYSEPPADGFPRVWRVQIAGQDLPVNEAALTWGGALDLLRSRLDANAWWANATAAETPPPRPTSFTALKEPGTSLWHYLSSPFRSRP